MQLLVRKFFPKVIIAGVFGVVLSACVSSASSPSNKSEFEYLSVDPSDVNYNRVYAQVRTVQGPAKFIYVAGTVDRPLDYTPGSNRCQHEDWHGQYIGLHENIERSLKAVGATWNDVVFIRRFTTDMQSFKKMFRNKENPLPNYWEGHRPPPSTAVQVVAFSEKCQLMEVDVFAVIEDSRE